MAIDEHPVLWSRYCGETQAIANAASFTVPQAEGNKHVDVGAL